MKQPKTTLTTTKLESKKNSDFYQQEFTKLLSQLRMYQESKIEAA